MTDSKKFRKARPAKQMIGWREIVSLPELGLNSLKAKTDTGARTTALHASNIVGIEIAGQPWVEFVPDHDEQEAGILCKAPVMHIRNITNTSGIPEERYIIATRLCIGKLEHRIEISLTNRSGMKFPVILGRTALRLMRLNVNPSRSWLLTKNSNVKTKKLR